MSVCTDQLREAAQMLLDAAHELERLRIAEVGAFMKAPDQPAAAQQHPVVERVEIELDRAVVYGSPGSDDEAHNCDAMGCPSVDHVLAVVPFTTRRCCPVCRKLLAEDEIIGSCVHNDGKHRRAVRAPDQQTVSFTEPAVWPGATEDWATKP